MSLRPSLIPIIVALLCFNVGCAFTPSSGKTTPIAATSVFLDGTKAEAYEIARNALLQNGIAVSKGSVDEGFVAGDAGVTAFSWGEVVAVYYIETTPARFQIWVESNAKLATNITAKDWTPQVLTALIQGVERSKLAKGSTPSQGPAPTSPTVAAVSPPLPRQTDAPRLALSNTVIRARIDGDFNGFEEGRVFVLEDGSIWRQTSLDISVSIQLRPDVIVFPDGASWKFVVVGDSHKPVTVERLK